MAMLIQKGGTMTDTWASATAMATVASHRARQDTRHVNMSTHSITATSIIHCLHTVHTITANTEGNLSTVITTSNRHRPTWITTLYRRSRTTIRGGTPIPPRPVAPVVQHRLKLDLCIPMGSEGELGVMFSGLLSVLHHTYHILYLEL